MSLAKKACILILFSSFLGSGLKAQNLFDYQSSYKYASYLTAAGEFELAAVEWTRVAFFKPNNDSVRFGLLDNLFRMKDYKELVNQYGQMINSDKLPTVLISKIYLQTALHTENFQFWNKALDIVSPENISQLKALPDLFKDTEVAELWKSKKAPDELEINGKYKRPFLAGVFSTILPGTGKIYTKDYLDGSLALFFTSFGLYQAVQSYNRLGPKHAYFYIFGFTSLGFYGGNIVGSVKAAKDYNIRTINQAQDVLKSKYSFYTATI